MGQELKANEQRFRVARADNFEYTVSFDQQSTSTMLAAGSDRRLSGQKSRRMTIQECDFIQVTTISGAHLLRRRLSSHLSFEWHRQRGRDSSCLHREVCRCQLAAARSARPSERLFVFKLISRSLGSAATSRSRRSADLQAATIHWPHLADSHHVVVITRLLSRFSLSIDPYKVLAAPLDSTIDRFRRDAK